MLGARALVDAGRAGAARRRPTATTARTHARCALGNHSLRRRRRPRNVEAPTYAATTAAAAAFRARRAAGPLALTEPTDRMRRSMLRSSNPALSPARFRDATGDGVMTVAGTAVRALVLLLLVMGSAAYTWWQLIPDPTLAPTLVMGGLIGGLVIALVTIFRPQLAPWTSPVYAVVEGMALGSLSMTLNAAYAGLPMQAVALTFGVFLAMLALYGFRIVRVTQRLRTFVMSAVIGIMIFYVLTLVLGFFGVGIPAIHEGGPIGIGISLVTSGVAALALLLDFDLIEEGSKAGAPKFMEWYGAFGLIVTLVWLYIELLNLLRKLRD